MADVANIPKEKEKEVIENSLLGTIGTMGDYIISKERILWQESLREFHQLERDDDEDDQAVKALEMEYKEYCLIGNEIQMKLKEALSIHQPIGEKNAELSFRMEKAKTSMEREEALRKETEKLLSQEMQFKDNQITGQREGMSLRFKIEIAKQEKNRERERLKMRIECETNSEKLIKAESEIKEMMKLNDELKNMRKEHTVKMTNLKKDLKGDEEKSKVEIDKIQRQQIQQRTETRSKEKLWAEDCKAKESTFGKEMAMKEMSWKTERHKLLKKNRTLALKSSFTEHWIKDLEEQIRTVGAEILEKKRSCTVNIQVLEEKCIAIMRDQAIDPEPLKQLCRTKLNLSDTMPSANKKNSIWKTVDGWK